MHDGWVSEKEKDIEQIEEEIRSGSHADFRFTLAMRIKEKIYM